MVHIAVCEDEPSALDQTCQLVQQTRFAQRHALMVSSFSTGEEFLSTYTKGCYDIVFFDIYLPGISGIALAQHLRSVQDTCAIVFLTSSDGHAVQGFALHAVHYLLKPAALETLDDALARCEPSLSKPPRVLTVQQGKLEIAVRLQDIVHIEVFDKVSILHTCAGEVRTYMPLDKLAHQLDDARFLRCHRCSIINMDHVASYTPTGFAMDSGEHVPIRQAGSVVIRQQYVNYLFAHTRKEAEHV